MKEWEVRPGGLLVQKRVPEADPSAPPVAPVVCVKVKHGAANHEILISSQATFGEDPNRFPGLVLVAPPKGAR
ncbi:hypothetical protein BHE74_00049379 [Ensete ventricosum]|nr:hypothetical protein BHE74_00049379 [Ensete ventricosum]